MIISFDFERLRGVEVLLDALTFTARIVFSFDELVNIHQNYYAF